MYTVSIDKRRLNHHMTLERTMPLQLQVLVEHFSVECRARSESGLIVSDWSNHALDAHASKCIATFAISRNLPVHPGIYYASSKSSHAIQTADLIAGIRRRALEGDSNLQSVDDGLAAIYALSSSSPGRTHAGRAYKNRIPLI